MIRTQTVCNQKILFARLLMRSHQVKAREHNLHIKADESSRLRLVLVGDTFHVEFTFKSGLIWKSQVIKNKLK